MSSNLERENEISRGPFEWIMSEPTIAPTFAVSPDIRVQGTGASIGCDLVDENSELLNITRKYSRCPETRYTPGNIGVKVTSQGNKVDFESKNKMQPAQNGYCGQKPRVSFPDCNLQTENTRLTTPLCTAKEVGYNRWDYLHFDPQKNVSIPFDHNINNRNIVKDNHRPCVPVPLDQSACLPGNQ
jgi:hypothetical protein|tara:strand:- start:295 stop:849 length:555 start_codon:yes stop_codon:yes gene_type:complete